jgi:hypothetical protein
MQTPKKSTEHTGDNTGIASTKIDTATKRHM